jgi:hypothetical protein
VIWFTRILLRPSYPLNTRLVVEANLKGPQMAAAIARLLARGIPASQLEAEILKQLALLCGAGLAVSLLIASYGVDLNVAGF